MAVTVVPVSVRKGVAPATWVVVTFNDGTGREYASLADMQTDLREFETVDLAQHMAIARMIALSPDLSNTAQTLNKNCVLDFSAINVFRIQ